MREQFRPVPGYEGLYEVGERGTVRSISRLCTENNGHGGLRTQLRKGVVLAQALDKNGYFRGSLSSADGREKHFRVHRLVALTFLTDSWFEGAVVDHIDYNRQNNYVWNLRWVTQKQNVNHSKHRMHPELGRRKRVVPDN